jgi:hypothetical protein
MLKAKFKPYIGIAACVLAGSAFWMRASTSEAVSSDWTRVARIAAYGLQHNNARDIVRQATESHVFGIEIDNDITGRYLSFLDPDEKLKAIRAVAQETHRAGNRAFVYIAGTECITANADQTRHTLAKDHPDWLQRKISGEPAIFGGGSAFWIAKGDEDVWISPYARGWRKIYMERVRQIAATGIDGIYVDIPYWMTHFDGWEDSWASFDDYTVAAFRQSTGLDARRDLKLGNFSGPNFRKWVDFRIQTITDFIQEIARTAKSVSPEIKIIPEIYPGIEEEAVRVGADVYSLYPVADAIAHEYEFGSGDHMASSRSQLDWFEYQVGMATFRAFAEGKATWMLNYSWDGDDRVDAKQSMQNLAMSQVMAGANFWDAKGHVMSGSNDLPTRQKIFRWIQEHQNIFYQRREPLNPIGVYFSPATRNYFAGEFVPSFRGIMIQLLQNHLEYQIVTPRTLQSFRGKVLVLPDVRMLDNEEKDWLRRYVADGNRLLIYGTDATELKLQKNIIRDSSDPGKSYMSALEKDFEHSTVALERNIAASLNPQAKIRVQSAAAVATHIAKVDGKLCVFMANFKGLRGHQNPVQAPETGARIVLEDGYAGKMSFLPFLGDAVALTGTRRGQRTVFVLPRIQKGAVVCAEPKQE